MKYPFCDSHCDFFTALNTEQQRDFIKTRPSAQIINCAIFTTEQKLNIKNIIEYKNILNKLSCLTRAQLLFSIEDLGTIPPNEIDSLISLAPFCASLTWNDANQYAGGALSSGRLTLAGKRAIRLIEENGSIIDTAHFNEHSFWQICKQTNKPLLNTHSNIFSLHPHPRNLKDKQIENIVLSNGYMGLTFYEKFIANHKIYAKDLALQFDYIIKHFGHKNFGLGTDFYGVDNHFLPQDLKSHDYLYNLVNELSLLGYSQNIIEDILYKNFANFVKNNYFLY